MSQVSSFGNFLNLTRETVLTGERELLNEAAKNTYLLNDMLRGRQDADVVRGGTKIVERVKVSDQGNFGPYTPGDERTPNRKTTTANLEFGYRFYENEMPYTTPEMEYNDGASEYERFKSFAHSLRSDLNSDHINGMEVNLTARPDAALMEPLSVTGGTMASIFHFISEDDTAFHPPGYTTIAGVDPGLAANSWWRNPVETYNAAALDGQTDGIFAGLDRLLRRLGFETPPNAKEYFESDDMRKMKLLTNGNGFDIFSQLLRSANDFTRAGPQDPSYGSPVFKGFPVRWINNLDTELLEQNPAASFAYTGNPYPNGKPRFIPVNCKYIYPVFKKGHLMKEIGPVNGGIKQRDLECLWKESHVNLVCRSRKRGGGILRPTT